MAKVKITGHASGTGVLTVTAPNTSTDRTITLPDATGTLLNSDGSGANLTSLPNGSQLDHSGTKKIEATATGVSVTGASYSTSNIGLNAENHLGFSDDSFARLVVNDTEICRVLSTGGITFNGDTAAANSLDDYEEGTWTPVVKDQDGTVSPSFTTTNTIYTKIGRMVTITANIASISNVGLNVGGDVRVYGIPFTVVTPGTGAVNMEDVNYKDSYTTTESLTAYAANTYVYFRINRPNGGSQGLEAGDLNSTTSGFHFTVTYFV